MCIGQDRDGGEEKEELRRRGMAEQSLHGGHLKKPPDHILFPCSLASFLFSLLFQGQPHTHWIIWVTSCPSPLSTEIIMSHHTLLFYSLNCTRQCDALVCDTNREAYRCSLCRIRHLPHAHAFPPRAPLLLL